MPKLIPVATEFTKPFWDAVQEKRLVVRKCTSCNTLQYPPKPSCRTCGSEKLEWTETSGKGHILTYMVVEDGRLGRRIPDQPFNIAVVTLDDDPRINFYSNLAGVPVKEVPVGAAVEVVFEEVAPGRLIHEWRVVG